MTNVTPLTEETKVAEEESYTDTATLLEWSEAVSQDLQQIAALHDKEADADLISALKDVNFPYNLGMLIACQEDDKTDEKTKGIFEPQRFVEAALHELPEELDQTTLDQLAVDYADIYLNHSLHASPFESVWLDEDHLIQQEPMFQIREWFKRYGLKTENWRIRSEDHLVLQLQFIATLLDPQADISSKISKIPQLKRMQDATMFMDEHLLLWIEDFCRLVSQRCSTDFYASIAILTNAYIQELRDTLAEITAIKRPTAEEIEEKRRTNQPVVEEPVSFIPGVAESW